MGYNPPFGALDIPHPRQPADILFRSLAVHLFAAVAYLHLLHLLRYRKPHGPRLAGGAALFCCGTFLALPAFLPLQLLFWFAPALALAPWRRRVWRRLGELAHGIDSGDESGRGEKTATGAREPAPPPDPARALTPRRLLGHGVFAVLNSLCLAAVLGAYRQRLAMRYHAATNVGCLALDHRNGWAAAGGLLAEATVGALALLIAVAGTVGVGSGAAGEAGGSRGSTPQMEEGRAKGGRSRSGTASSAIEAFEDFLSADALGVDWSLVIEAVYAAFIQQIFLALIHQVVPVLAFLKKWYLWPVIAFTYWYILSKRRAKKETVALCTAVGFILFTAAAQFGSDMGELWDVSHGNVQSWNYRWQIKDWFSAANSPDSQ